MLGGCGASPKEVLTWVLNSAQNGYVPKRSKRFGCGPGDCSNFCEKSLGGVCLGGHLMRLAACQFGARTSEYGMGSRKYMLVNRWKRARKGLLHKEALGQCSES